MTQVDMTVSTPPMDYPSPASASANESLGLPDDYAQNVTRPAHPSEEYWTDERIRLSRAYQSHVYRWAARCAKRRSKAAVLDLGCGVGTKIEPILLPCCHTVTGMDTAESIAKAKQLGSLAEFVEVDLESPNIKAWRTFDVIICADVIEHLVNPGPLLTLIHDFSHSRTDVILSTPDRDRLRGRQCRSCDKPDHVREWSRSEFRQYLCSRGLHVLTSRLLPQGDSAIRKHLTSEFMFRTRLAATSPLACHAVLCRSEQIT